MVSWTFASDRIRLEVDERATPLKLSVELGEGLRADPYNRQRGDRRHRKAVSLKTGAEHASALDPGEAASETFSWGSWRARRYERSH